MSKKEARKVTIIEELLAEKEQGGQVHCPSLGLRSG